MGLGKGKIKQFFKRIFDRYFGFEKDIDITSEVKVLHRRNEVLKNITFLSNILYTIILFVLASITKKPSDYLFTALFFPFTFFINIVISQLITKDRHNYTIQTVAMYIMALYIFLISILFYARFYNSIFEIAAYVLIYYSVVVISLYQSKKLTLWSFGGMAIAITIIHFTITYQMVGEFQGMKFWEFLSAFTKHQAFGDYLLRIFIFIAFNIVIYSIVSIGEFLLDERRREALRRSEVQEDYLSTVTDLFQIILTMKADFLDNQNSYLVFQMSKKLAEVSGFDRESRAELNNFVEIHLKINEIEEVATKELVSSLTSRELKGKTDLANQIAKRIRITRMSDNILRTIIQGTLDESFVKDISENQSDFISQIILISELYIGLRSTKSYKRPFPHLTTIDLFKNEFKVFLDKRLLERLITFQDDFKDLYLNN